jgi:TMEM192 family
VRVTRFNKVQPPPDVQREEWLASVIDDSLFKKGDVGFRYFFNCLKMKIFANKFKCLLYRERTDQTTLLLEQQADLIRYLKEHNAHLGQKLVELSSRLSGEHD